MGEVSIPGQGFQLVPRCQPRMAGHLAPGLSSSMGSSFTLFNSLKPGICAATYSVSTVSGNGLLPVLQQATLRISTGLNRKSISRWSIYHCFYEMLTIIFRLQCVNQWQVTSDFTRKLERMPILSNQLGLGQWPGAIRQQAITWVTAVPDIYHHTAPL